MPGEQPATFGGELRRLREAAGLSQEDLAGRAGLSPNAIGALERGERQRPYPHTVQLLADALKLDEKCRAALIRAVPRRRPAPTPSAPTAESDAVNGAHDRNARSQPSQGQDAAIAESPASITGHIPAPFIGRRAEMAILSEKLTAAFAGQGSIAVVSGEAGIGKTRLSREFADYAASRGAVVLWGCCFEGDWQPPYGPWVEAMGAYAGSVSPGDLRRDLGANASLIAQLVPGIRAALPDLASPTSLTPDDERSRLYDAIIRFVLTVSEQQPVLLVLDDLHWADADSLRLFRHLARFVERARVLTVGAYRDPEFGLNEKHPLMNTLSVLRREVDYEAVAIRGFDRSDMGDYLAGAAGQPLPQALSKVITEETNGNPFYAREVFRHLAEESKILHRGGRWTTDISIRELGIPDGVRQVVGRRVGRLSEQTGALLKLASGFNAGFGFDVLQALSGFAEQELLDCIDEALQAGLVKTSSQSPPRYEFAHAIVRHTLYDGLNPDRRARLHRRIAEALEQVRGGAESDVAEMAAQYHASAMFPGAGKGIPCAIRAAEQARTVYAHERVIRFLRMARDLASESSAGEKADILRRLAIAEAEAVELEDAHRTTEEALGMMKSAGIEPRVGAEFLADVVQRLKDGGAVPDVWQPLVERGLAMAGGTRDLIWARLALVQDHVELLRSGPIGGTRWLGHDPEAVRIARAEGNEDDYAGTLNPLDWRTRNETDAILALARQWSSPMAITHALEVAGRDLLYRWGDVRDALAVYEELLSVSERFGSIPVQAEALTHIATIQMVTGQWSVGKETMQRAHDLITRLGAGHRIHGFAPLSRAALIAYFLDGDWASLEVETRAFATSDAAWHSSVGMVAGAIAALCAARAGNVTAARELLQHATSVLKQAGPTTYAQSTAVAWAGAAAWELDAKELAADYRNLALDLLILGVGDTGFGPLELLAARASSLLGDYDTAQEYFDLARTKLIQSGWTHMLAIAEYDQACSLIRAGATNKALIMQLLGTAISTFRSYNMPAWAQAAAEKEDKLST